MKVKQIFVCIYIQRTHTSGHKGTCTHIRFLGLEVVISGPKKIHGRHGMGADLSIGIQKGFSLNFWYREDVHHFEQSFLSSASYNFYSSSTTCPTDKHVFTRSLTVILRRCTQLILRVRQTGSFHLMGRDETYDL